MTAYNTGVTGSATNITAATAFTFTVPAGVLVGDVMIVSLDVFSFSANTFGMSTPSSGGGAWTQIGTVQPGSQGSLEGWGSAWYRVATASDPGSTFTVSWTGTTGGGNQFWWASDLEAYTGFWTGSGGPIGNIAQAASNASSVVTPTTNTARANSWAIQTCPTSVSGGGTITGEPATNRHVINPGAGVNNAISDSNGSVGAAGTSIGGGTFTLSASSSGAGIAFTIELYTQGPPTTTAQTTPPRIPHPRFLDLLLEEAYQRADWQAQGVATPVPQTWRLMDGLNGRPGIGSSGTQPPAAGTANGTNQVTGTMFYVTQGGMWFQGFWYYCCASGQSTSPAKFALWTIVQGGGSVVPGSVVTSGTLTAGAWNYVPLPQPVQLALYGQYVAAVGVPNGAGYPDTVNQFGSAQPYQSGITSGPLAAFSDSTGLNAPPYGDGQGCITTSGSDPALVFGNGSANHDNFWLDVQVSNTPPAGYNGSYRLWPNMRDASSATVTDSAVNYVIGTEIILSQACYVNAIWYYVAAGQGATNNQWATSADIWRVRDGVRVATQPNPVWINPYAGGVDVNSNSGRWVYCTLPGQVFLPPGDYYFTVYNGNGSPNGWGVTQFHYWQSGSTPGNTYLTAAAGVSGITNGPLYAPTTPAASMLTDYNNPAVQEAGQSVFAVGPPNQFPNRYVGSPTGGAFQNYWIDAEVTPSSTFTPNEPNLPQQIPHPLFYDLLQVYARKMEPDSGTSPAPPGSATIVGVGTLTANAIQGAGATLTASGLLAASVTQGAVATLTGAGVLASNIQQGSGGSFGGAGTLSVNAIQSVIASLAGAGTLSANAIQGAAATMTGLGILASNAIQGSGGNLTGTGTVTVNATQSVIAAMAGAGTLTAVVIQGATASLTGLGVVSAGSQAGGGSMSGSGSVSVNAIQGAGLSAAGAGLLAASVVQGAGLTAVASGLVTISGTQLAGATLTGLGVVTAAQPGGSKSALLLVFLP